jgi:DUF2946 family protein
MNAISSKQTQTRYKPWLFAVAFALLVQSLFPSGYMPGKWSDGWLAVLCPEGMPVAFMRQLMGGQHQHHAGGGHHSSAHDHDGASMGDCQLGSALDQPLDVFALFALTEADLVSPVLRDRTLFRTDRQVVTHTRSRAPPVA